MQAVIKLFKNQYFYLCLIIILAFWVRLYKINDPVAAWHSWRQADTAAVSRNFFKDGFMPFVPKYDDMTAVSDTGRVNLERFRFVEFPIYNSLVYFAYLINGKVDESLARLVSILFSLGSIIFLFLITKRNFGVPNALLAALFFASLPFIVYYSQVILPEPSLVFFCLGMYYFVQEWLDNDSRLSFFLGVIFAQAAFLTKPVAIFYLIPFIYVIYKKENKIFPFSRKHIYFLLLALGPLLLWRIWMSRFPDGIPSAGWLINGNNIRFRPAFWRWIISDRLSREILSPIGLMIFSLGTLIKPSQKENFSLHFLNLGMFLYLIIVATGNVQHDYYQYLITPVLAIFLARGFLVLFQGRQFLIPRLWTIPVTLLLLGLTFYLGWYEVKGLYQINNGVIVEAGKRADTILPENAKVIAPYNSDTAFLYQTNRPGFPAVVLSIEEMVERFGITHFVSVNYDNDTNYVINKFWVIEKNPRFVIADLTKTASNSATLNN